MIASIIFGILVFGYILQPAAPIAYNMVTVYLPTMFMTGIAHMFGLDLLTMFGITYLGLSLTARGSWMMLVDSIAQLMRKHAADK